MQINLNTYILVPSIDRIENHEKSFSAIKFKI